MDMSGQKSQEASFIEAAKHRYRRSTGENCGKKDGRTCSLRLQSDTFLWDHIMKNVDKNEETAITEITSLFYNHVSVAKQIYSSTKFQTNDFEVIGINFRVNRIVINTTKNCEGTGRKTNPFCADNVDVINFLNLNAFMDHSKFCLAYVFTYRDFQRGTLGLAWVGDANNAGGICEWYREIPEGGVPVYKSLNTGVVTLLNYGSPVSMRVSQSTFAHEMGHNFGATHDDDSATDARQCVPGASSKSGNFIMFSSATGGDKPNNLKFSACSKVKIANQLKLVINCNNNKKNCLVEANGAFCGNKLVEHGSDGVREECDCGFEDNNECSDVCCNPASSKKTKGCTLKDTAQVQGKTVKVHCSPTAGECCDKGCQFKNNKTICDHGHDCRKRSFCTGRNASCILTDPLPDYSTLCMNNTRTCFKGECTASICKHFDLEECFVSYKPEKKASKANEMCFVACRNGSVPNAPCVSTYQLMRDEARKQVYPPLAAFLRNTKGMMDGIRMKPGAPCDNYRGYCDVFSRCRLIDADGPLTRLKNLIFSPRTLTVIRQWIIQNWYYVMLMSLGVVLFMALFVKCCAVHTPSSNPNAPRARSLTETLRRGPRRHHEDGRRGGTRDERVELDAIGYRPGPADPTHIEALRGPNGDRPLRYAEAPPPYDQATPGHGHGRGRRQQAAPQGKPQPKPRGKKKGKARA